VGESVAELAQRDRGALYPGVALIEGTNVSVGRGTDTPFELVGAPWIKSKELAAYLNARGIAGVRFVPVTFTPTASVYAGRSVRGEHYSGGTQRFDAPELGIELAAALQKIVSRPISRWSAWPSCW
jgi:uncharacterized protein YbbC (DUF1343 family)